MLNNQILQTLLTSQLGANLARIKCFAVLITAVLCHRSVNLTLLATTTDGKKCSNQSRYRRFQEFFLSFDLNLTSIGKIVLDRLAKPSNGFVLAMDRTNWKFGAKHINFLVISCITGKVSIPLVWMVLPAATKRGNSNTSQRIKLVSRLLEILPAQDIRALTMDREFVGKQWLSWLNDEGVAFVVRAKKSTQIDGKRADWWGKNQRNHGKQIVFGMELYFAIKKLNSENNLLVISNRLESKDALKLYKMRWGIERLFGHLKKKGFDLESTHMTNPAKLEKLFAVLVLAFLFSYGWGCELKARAKKLSAASRRKSLFRLGLEDLLRMFLTITESEADRVRRSEFSAWLDAGKFSSIFLV